MQFRKSDKTITKEFTEKKVNFSIAYDTIQNRIIRSVKTGNGKEKLIVFIHGAPGSSQDNYHFLSDSSLLDKFDMISLDRPGYGYSGFGKAEKSVMKQAEILNTLIQEKNKGYDKTILVGHSFGGPIVGLIASINSEYHYVIMLAPAMDPNHEKIFWITHMAKWPVFRWLTPRAWRVAADEKLSHIESLKEVENDWANIKSRILHIHGNKDVLVPYENLDFAKRKISSDYLETMTLDGENHFLPWSQEDLIKEILLKEAK